MSTIRFDETPRGVRFYDRQLPQLIKAITENTQELKRANDLKEAELELVHGVKLYDDRDNSVHDSRS